MSKNFIILVLVFGLMFLGFVSGVVINDVKIDKNLVENFKKLENQSENKIRILIKLKNESRTFDSYFRIFNNKKETFEKINIDKGKINKEIRGYVSAYIDKEDLEKLKTNKFVESIDIEQTYHALLQDSMDIINASSVWNLKKNKLNLTGTSQSVCIIDTGVNYSHPDLGGGYGNNTNFSYKIIGGWDFCGNDEDCTTEDDDPMDVNGHGTHVSGIVVASGSITGTGPNAKIVMMKAANSSGVFFTLDIVSAIDWCVNNASKFNISVISMSLGGGLHPGYCDGDNTAMTDAINDAVANNISVVVATGNNGSSTHIASPACITNATRVGATDKNDSIASYSNRNSIVKLFATGSNINSTLIDGGYGGDEWSGTSMSTPMAAGVIAIINQYLNLSGQLRAPSEIENILYNTGLQFNESSNNFSRINVYDAILSLDVDVPNVTLVSPTDNKVNLTINQTFVCNVTDWQLANATFYLWNSSHEIINQTSFNISGTENQTEINIINLSYGNYLWNCLVVDAEGNSDFASANYTLIIGGIFVNLTSPLNNSYTNINETNFACNLTSEEIYELSNVTFYLWNSSALVKNETRNISGINNKTIFGYNLTEETSYSWNCFGINNDSYNSSAENNFTITYDATAPNISLSENLPTSVTSNSAPKNFSFNVSDNNIANCSLVIGGSVSLTNSSVNVSATQLFSQTFTPGTYNWQINCSDLAGNMNSSEENSFTITAVPTISSNSGGGGGGGGVKKTVTPKVYEVSVAEAAAGYTQRLKKDEKMNFSIFDFEGGRHLLTIDKVGADYVELTIESGPINLKLGVGQSAKLNLTSAVYYDLFVKLNKIVGNFAELTIQLINEPIEVKVVEVVREEIVETEVLVTKNHFWAVGVLSVLLIFAVGVIVLLIIKVTKKLKRRRALKRKIKKHGNRKGHNRKGYKNLSRGKNPFQINLKLENGEKRKKIKT